MAAKEKKNEITDGVFIEGLTLHLPKEKTLIIADLHLGYEEMLNQQGVMMPRSNYADIKKHLQEVFRRVKKLKKIIVNGDLKHEFGLISPQEWREVLDMLDLLKEHCEEIVLVKGNHDRILGPLARKKKLKIVDAVSLRKGKLLVLHGHELPKDDKKLKKVETVIIAHEHPVVGLREDARVDKFKAFLKGDWQGKTLVVMPSLLQVTTGIDVTREKRLSPFLQRDLSFFQCWLFEQGNVYSFKRLADLYA